MHATQQNTRLNVMTTLAAPATFGAVLRHVWPRHTAKMAAAAAGQSVRTAQAWVASRCEPSASTLLRMARENEALRIEMVRLLTEGKAGEGMEDMVGAASGARSQAEGAALGTDSGRVARVGSGALTK